MTEILTIVFHRNQSENTPKQNKQTYSLTNEPCCPIVLLIGPLCNEHIPDEREVKAGKVFQQEIWLN